MIPVILGALATAKKWPWKLIAWVAGILFLLFGIWLLGRYLYDLGYEDSEDQWEARIATLEARAGEIADDAERRHRQITHRINSALATETEQLEGMNHASDIAFLRAYAGADKRLRDSANAGRD